MKRKNRHRHNCITRPRRKALQYVRHSRGNLWFSELPVPEQVKRLRTGEPIPQDLYDLVVKGVREAIHDLPPGWPLKAKWLVGRHVWDDLSRGDRIRAGRCLADIARREDSPIGLLRRPGQSHRYFVRLARNASPSITPEA